MSMWSYPAGAIINGVPTDHRTVRRALPVTINGVQYSVAIFSSWTPAQLAALGIKSWAEDSVPEHYSGGAPVDVETDTHIQRTYPNPVLQPEPWRVQLQAAIQAKKIAKRDGGFIVDETLFDSDAGANVAYLNFDTRIAADPLYSTPWKASGNIWVTMNATLFALVSAGFQANMEAAFSWQAQMDAALAEAPDTFAALSAIEVLINT